VIDAISAYHFLHAVALHGSRTKMIGRRKRSATVPKTAAGFERMRRSATTSGTRLERTITGTATRGRSVVRYHGRRNPTDVAVRRRSHPARRTFRGRFGGAERSGWVAMVNRSPVGMN
jgi:hypothetical protein